MYKIKHERTADCVVGGFRWHKDGAGVGSLLLGLYDDQRVPAPCRGGLWFFGRSAKATGGRAHPLPPRRHRRPSLAGNGARHRGYTPSRLAEPVERQQGPLLAGRGPRARLRGLLRPPPGRQVPSRNLVPTLAHRPPAGVLHLCPARGGRPRGAGPGLRVPEGTSEGRNQVEVPGVRPPGSRRTFC